MAGNIVKWWKHKILGGYKQFSVLQECQTDSEELIYQARASSSCSAPPDLLITSDPESQILKNHVNNKSNNHYNHHHQHSSSNNKNGLSHTNNKDINNKHRKEDESNYNKENTNIESEDRVRLEEFTCDVSLEDNSKQQPLQFSFTLYDLDGHGKITKDDIAGIVSTIYESIGKSVVVPHYGSKTINVRLTVSPDSKTRPNSFCHKNNNINSKHMKDEKLLPNGPRLHRQRRKLLLSDDEEDEDHCSDTSGDLGCRRNSKRDKRLSKDCTSSTTTNTGTTDSANENRNLINNKNRVCINETTNDYFNNKINNKQANRHSCREDLLYENINNLKSCTKNEENDYLIDMNSCHNDDFGSNSNKNNDIDNCNILCKDCPAQACPFDIALQKSNNNRKMLRKSRSRKQKNGVEGKPRARSLSVGHENMWKMESGRNEEQQQCWKSPLKRHELIEIIRESMEKNRLCFQPNRKPIETPLKHRNRSHTVTTNVIESLSPSNLTPKHTSNSNSPHHESNLCGYDSFLHATICTNAKNSVHVSASHPMVITGPNRLTHNHKNRLRTKHHTSNLASYHHNHHQSKQVQQQHPSRETAPMKLSTSLLNQLNPNLSAEQKMNRSINQVELWLETKDIRGSNNDSSPNTGLKVMKNSLDNETPLKCLNNNANINNNNNNNSQSNKKSEIKSNNIELKITEEDLNEDLHTIVSPKKTFNKEVLISAATRKPIKTLEQTTPNNQRIIEYASIPIAADPIECENLLIKDEEIHEEIPQNNVTLENVNGSTTTSNTTPSTVTRYVHIHHHYHHFDAEDEE